MILVSDLRLGNAFIAEGRTQYVDFLNRHTINLYNEDQCYPIPLTAEILENTDLVKEGDFVFCSSEDIRNKSAKDVGISYCSFFYNNRLGKWMDSQSRVTVDYLHELQNLYSSITKEELEINL